MSILFTKNSLHSSVRTGDGRRFEKDVSIGWHQALEKISLEAIRGEIRFEAYSASTIKSRTCISLHGYASNLVARALTRYLSKAYQLRSSSRDQIIEEVIEALQDRTPIYVTRCDIASFYENVPARLAEEEISTNPSVPLIAKNYIRLFLDKFSPSRRGVPRGIGLSAVLAELTMRNFDRSVREIEGVYRYVRYSDDILVLSYLDSKVKSHLEQLLPDGLSFNKKKSWSIDLACEDKKLVSTHSIEYLGYQLSINDLCNDRDPREVRVSISNRKLNKLKTRVLLSLKKFQNDLDAELLYDRIRFISGNYCTLRYGASFFKRSRYVKSGIFFNYSLCGTYTKTGPTPYDCRELKALDGFYQSLLFSKTSEFSEKVILLTQDAKKKLSSLSFYKGYAEKIMVRYRPDRVQEIKRAWRNG